MTTPDDPLETARLTIRPFVMDDLDALFAIHSRADVTRFLLWSPRSRPEVQDELGARLERTDLRDEGDVLQLAVVLQATGALIGDVNLGYRSAVNSTAEVGYVFDPAVAGQGYASEAARAMVALAFEHYRFHRVIGRLDARNVASARVLERLGMRREAHFRRNEFVKGEWCDEVVYALLADEWPTGPLRADVPTRRPNEPAEGADEPAERS